MKCEMCGSSSDTKDDVSTCKDCTEAILYLMKNFGQSDIPAVARQMGMVHEVLEKESGGPVPVLIAAIVSRLFNDYHCWRENGK